jgi:hypothetical protein
LWTLFVLSLFLSLCNPMFFAAIPPSCGFHWLLLFEERERESQIVQVFAPISLGIFVVLTGFCLMRESHNFLSTLSFLLLLLLLILPTCPFFSTSTFYLSTYFSSYLSHPPTYLLTYLPTLSATYLNINLSISSRKFNRSSSLRFVI